MAQAERKLAAIMLADIAGYSTLMERDESRTFIHLRAMRELLINPKVAEFGGRIVKTTGDGFLAEFPSATAAFACGITIQRANHAQEANKDSSERFHLRIGINLGDIIVDGDDISGDGVNIAARLEPLAPLDGICISGAVRDQVREDLGVVLEDLGEQHVKNIARPIRAYRIDLANARASEPPAASEEHAAKVTAPPPPTPRRLPVGLSAAARAVLRVVVGGGAAVMVAQHPDSRRAASRPAAEDRSPALRARAAKSDGADQRPAACVKYASDAYEGGDDPSPIEGQSKAEAWCACVLEKAPNLTASIASFLETERGKRVDAACDTYADWGE